MDSWLKKSQIMVISVLADDVEAVVKTNANRVFANVFVYCKHWVPVSCFYFFPLNNHHKYTTHSVYYFNDEGSRKFLED